MKGLSIFLIFLFFGSLISEKSNSQNVSIPEPERKSTVGIRIDPEYPMWFIDNDFHPYLAGVSESETFSSFWEILAKNGIWMELEEQIL